MKVTTTTTLTTLTKAKATVTRKSAPATAASRRNRRGRPSPPSFPLAKPLLLLLLLVGAATAAGLLAEAADSAADRTEKAAAGAAAADSAAAPRLPGSMTKGRTEEDAEAMAMADSAVGAPFRAGAEGGGTAAKKSLLRGAAGAADTLLSAGGPDEDDIKGGGGGLLLLLSHGDTEEEEDGGSDAIAVLEGNNVGPEPAPELFNGDGRAHFDLIEPERLLVDEEENEEAAHDDARPDNMRHLQRCAPIACVPDLHLASVAQALANPETQFYDEDGSVCRASFRTVLILAGLKNCRASIGSVRFAWTRPDGSTYRWVERAWPYTVFSDGYPASVQSRALGPGPHKVEAAVRRPNGCTAWAGTFAFRVRADACPAHADKVLTRPPTRSPTRRPTAPPTKRPTGPPTAVPTQNPTTQDDAAFCRSLEYWQGHLYGGYGSGLTWLSVFTGPDWYGHQARLESMPRCCGGKAPHLASISSEEEAHMLLWLAGKVYDQNRHPELFQPVPEFWIGLTLSKDENGTGVVPVWTTGEELSVFGYADFILNGGDCFSLGRNGAFNSRGCYDALPALYEYDCEQGVPDPTVSYPESVPDDVAFCNTLTYYNGHLYHWINPNTFRTSVPFPGLSRDQEHFRPCCGGKWPHLVSIGDEAENDLVREVPVLHRSFDLLIGLSDLYTEGQFVWRNGEPVNYTNWFLPLTRNDWRAERRNMEHRFGPLFNEEHDCVRMNVDGSWAASPCTELDGSFLVPVYEWDCEVSIPEANRTTLPPSPVPLPTPAPTPRPTKAPTKKPSRQPQQPKSTLRPTLTRYPTIEPASAFCKSLTYHNGHLYGFDSTPRGWAESQSYLQGSERCCRGKVAHLVTILDDAENQVVESLAYPGYAWIGLSDSLARGDFRWVTNETFALANRWGVLGRPDRIADCTSMLSYDPMYAAYGRWEDRPCATLLPMVFEYDCDEAEDGPVPLPKNTLQPTSSPTFCQSLIPYEGHLYGAYKGKGTFLFEDLEEPFVYPEFGIEECCGKKAHLATLGRDGEVSAALSAIRQTANPGTDLFVIGASDRRMEWTAEWVDPDEPNTYPKFPSRCERRFSYAGQAPCLRYESLFTTYQGGNTEGRDCFALQLPGYIYSTECTAFQRFVFEYDCDVCDPDYVQFGGHQYGVVVSGRPFIEAVLHSEGGRAHKCCDKEPKLVTIESAAENAFVAALLQDVDEAWIGLSDLAFEGTYEWGLSGAVLANASYTNWAAGEPDDGGPRWRATEDCVVMRRADGKWYDTDCSFSKSYVIEFDCDS